MDAFREGTQIHLFLNATKVYKIYLLGFNPSKHLTFSKYLISCLPKPIPKQTAPRPKHCLRRYSKKKKRRIYEFQYIFF